MPRKPHPTYKQSILLFFYREAVAQRRSMPTIRELAVELGLSSSQAVYDRIEALVKKGYIKTKPETARGVTITDRGMRWCAQNQWSEKLRWFRWQRAKPGWLAERVELTHAQEQAASTFRGPEATDEQLAEFRAWLLKAPDSSGEPNGGFTCDECPLRRRCEWVFDSYNTDGDCIVDK